MRAKDLIIRTEDGWKYIVGVRLDLRFYFRYTSKRKNIESFNFRDIYYRKSKDRMMFDFILN